MRYKITNTHITEILSKMFEMVGETYSPAFVKEPDWFFKCSWSKQQEKEYISWLADYIRKHWRFSKAVALKEAEQFTFNYGWKYNDTE